MCRLHAVFIVNSIQKLSLHRAQGGRQQRCAVDRAVEGQTGVRKSLIISLQSFVLYTIFVNVTQNPAQAGQLAASHGVKPGITLEMSAGVPRNALYMGRRGLNHNNANKYRAGVPPCSCQSETGNSPGPGFDGQGGSIRRGQGRNRGGAGLNTPVLLPGYRAERGDTACGRRGSDNAQIRDFRASHSRSTNADTGLDSVGLCTQEDQY